MPLNWEITALPIVILATNLVGLIWFAFATSASAKAALRKSDDANRRINDLVTAFADYREQIAKEYLSRDAVSEIEDRLTAATREIENRLTAAIDRLADRLDRVLDARVRRRGQGLE